MMSLFPSFSKDAKQLQIVLSNFPESVKKAFSMSSLDLSSLLGFYGYIFSFVALCGAIQAMNLGLSILSAETRMKIADFLLTKPVTRYQIITSKLLAAVTCIGITNFIYIAASSIILQFIKTEAYRYKLFFMISITMLFCNLFLCH